MIDEIGGTILNSILERDNHKVIRGESLSKYLESFKNQELERLLLVGSSISDIDSNLKSKTKKDIIKQIKGNLKEIVESYIKIAEPIFLKEFKKIVSKGGYIKSYVSDFDINFGFILYVKKFSLAKVYYDKEKHTIEIYMPKGFVDVIKSALNNKKIKDYNKDYNNIISHVDAVTDTYGVITLDKLNEIINEQIKEVDRDFLTEMLLNSNVTDKPFSYEEYENTDLIYSLSFDNVKEAYEFYKKTSGEYFDFRKYEFEEINDGKYLDNLKSYKEFVNYLTDNYYDFEDEMEDIKLLIVKDFLYFAQINLNKGIDIFIDKMNRAFEITNADKKKLKLLAKNIFNEYPKWIKRGNI